MQPLTRDPSDVPPPARMAPARVEARFARTPAPQSNGWIGTGLYLMALPMTITMGLMLAPVIWMFGGRARQ